MKTTGERLAALSREGATRSRVARDNNIIRVVSARAAAAAAAARGGGVYLSKQVQVQVQEQVQAQEQARAQAQVQELVNKENGADGAKGFASPDKQEEEEEEEKQARFVATASGRPIGGQEPRWPVQIGRVREREETSIEFGGDNIDTNLDTLHY